MIHYCMGCDMTADHDDIDYYSINAFHDNINHYNINAFQALT